MVVVGCSGPESASSTAVALPSTTSIISVVDVRGVTVDVASTERIIPLDGDVAEIVFALGLGDHVVATDISAVYPPEADALPEIGYQRALSAEPIIDFEPTVVIGTDLAGPPEVLESLERLGVAVVIVPSPPTAAGPAMKIRAVGEALGVTERADGLASEVEDAIAEGTAMGSALGVSPRVVALYVRGTNTQLVLGEGSGIDWLIDAAGAVDVADELGVVDNAPIGAEAIVAAAPEVILVPALGLDSVGGVGGLLEIPGLAETPAGERGAVLAYEDQLMLGNGPRTGDFLKQLVSDLE